MKPAKDQLDQGLAFNGQGGKGYSRSPQRFQSNASGEQARENYGRGPTVAGRTGHSVPNPTARGGKINGGAQAKCPSNPDMIYAGRGPTKGNQQ